MQNEKFVDAIKDKIAGSIDTETLENELEGLLKEHRKKESAVGRLGDEIDSLDPYDKQYNRKYDDKQNRLSKLYDDIAEIEEEIEVTRKRLDSIQQQKISGESIYKILLYFDKMYNKFTDLQKKEFMRSFIDEVQIYEEPNENGQILKHIKFKFPVYYKGEEVWGIGWDNESTVETVCLLSKLHADQHIEVELQMDELDLTAAESKATYEEIKDYVLKQSGLKVSNLYIAQVKQKCGIIERANYNLPKSENSRQPQCPAEKEQAIVAALKHFGMV